MRVHEGAERALTFLRQPHRVVVITARRGAEWVRRNNLPYDEVEGRGCDPSLTRIRSRTSFLPSHGPALSGDASG
jgi:hypothetical protein